MKELELSHNCAKRQVKSWGRFFIQWFIDTIYGYKVWNENNAWRLSVNSSSLWSRVREGCKAVSNFGIVETVIRWLLLLLLHILTLTGWLPFRRHRESWPVTLSFAVLVCHILPCKQSQHFFTLLPLYTISAWVWLFFCWACAKFSWQHKNILTNQVDPWPAV